MLRGVGRNHAVKNFILDKCAYRMDILRQDLLIRAGRLRACAQGGLLYLRWWCGIEIRYYGD